MSSNDDAHTTQNHPLANGPNGEPLDVPQNAVAWRVRRGGGRRGRPRIVFDNETGRQLEVPITATIEDLVDCGCPAGRYRLEAVDRDGRLIPGIVGVTEIPADAGDEDNRSDAGAAPDHMTLFVHEMKAQSAILRDSLVAAMQTIAQITQSLGPQAPIVVSGGGSAPSNPPMKPTEIIESVAGGLRAVKDMLGASGAATPGGGGGP